MTANILNIVCGLVYILIVCINAAPSTKLPKGFIQCKLSDPNIDGCIMNAIQKAIPHLAKGVPSLGILKMDPLRIDKLLIDQDKLHYDPEVYSLDVELHPTKPIALEGDYEISGKVLILPIVGKGRCKINIEVSKLVGTVQAKPVLKNGNKHLEIVNISWKFTATKMNLKFDNLFNGDKALGDNMNVFLNENWRELIIELQPAIEEVFGSAFKEIGQQFLNRIALNQFILP